jgi:hypothetical protein
MSWTSSDAALRKSITNCNVGSTDTSTTTTEAYSTKINDIRNCSVQEFIYLLIPDTATLLVCQVSTSISNYIL